MTKSHTSPGCGLMFGGTDVLLELTWSEDEVAGGGIDLLVSTPACWGDGCGAAACACSISTS